MKTKNIEQEMRIKTHPVLGDAPLRTRVSFTWQSEIIEAYEGEALAAALLAQGIRLLRYSERAQAARGIYCNIGHCFECRVIVDGKRDIRACLTPVYQGMQANPQTLRKPDHSSSDES